MGPRRVDVKGQSALKSFDDRLREVGGFGPGFDFVRIALAFGVLIWHALAAVEGNTLAGKATIFWMPIYAILPMFFALSGFLVTGSALRLPLREYILNRSFRIVPALAVDIGLSALILGPIFTTYALSTYFTHPEFLRYFLNIVGYIHYELPGVFKDNRLAAVVNGSLWTVPWEIGCYVVMSLMIRFGLIRNLPVTVFLAVGWLVAGLLYFELQPQTGYDLVDRGLHFGLLANGAVLIPYFLFGAAFYLAKDRIPFDGRIAGLFVAGLLLASVFADGNYWWRQPILGIICLIPCVYIVVFLGLLRLPSLPVFNRGDYSYGVYLYHFPILQALQHLFGFDRWYLLFAAAFVPVTAMAMFSWHTIEKPILKQRKRFSLVGKRIAEGGH